MQKVWSDEGLKYHISNIIIYSNGALRPVEENILCSILKYVDSNETTTEENTTLSFNLSCNGTLYGRYLTVQLMGCGILELNEITISPSPSRLQLKSVIKN